MLVLGRKVGQRMRFDTSDGPIWLEVTKYDRGTIRLGILAPDSVVVTREELLPVGQRSPLMTLTKTTIAREQEGGQE